MTFDSSPRICPASAERFSTVRFSPGGIVTGLRVFLHAVPNLGPTPNLFEAAFSILDSRPQRAPEHLRPRSSSSRDDPRQLAPAPCRVYRLAILTVASVNSGAEDGKRTPPRTRLPHVHTSHREYLHIPEVTTARRQAGDTPGRCGGCTQKTRPRLARRFAPTPRGKKACSRSSRGNCVDRESIHPNKSDSVDVLTSSKRNSEKTRDYRLGWFPHW